MRISQALRERLDLAVTFPEGAVLNIVYSPSTYTVDELDELQSSTSKDPHRLVQAIRRLVLDWDLTDDEDKPIPLEEPLVEGEGGALVTRSEFVAACRKTGDPVPGNLPVDPLRSIPTHIFTRIIRAVNEDQTVSGESPRG